MLLTLLVPELEAAETAVDRAFSRSIYGGTLTIGHHHPSIAINPLFVNSGMSVSISNLIFNRLIRLGYDGKVEPDLAEAWDVSADGLVYTFYLRKDVYFHDGAKLTSADVLYTFETIGDASVGSPYFSSMKRIHHFETPDPYTFRAVLLKPYSPFIYDMLREIVPKHVYFGTDVRNNPANRHPVGTGPFRFREWTTDNRVTLEANIDYFGKRPYLDHIVFKTFRDKAEVWSAFMRGQTDFVRYISQENFEWTRQDEAFATYAAPDIGYYVLSYNLNDPLFSDRSVRRALAKAIDRTALIDKLEKGYGMESRGPFSPSSWAFDPSIPAFSFDPQAASVALRDAGWKKTDGNLEKNGVPFVFLLFVDSNDDKLVRISMHIRQQLQEIGVRVEIKPCDGPAEAVSKIKEPFSGKSRAYLTMELGRAPDPNAIASLWLSSDARRAQVFGYGQIHSDIDRLVLEGQTALTGPERVQVYRRLHRAIYEEQPACFLYFPYVFHAVSKKIRGADQYFESVYMPDDAIRTFFLDDQKAKGGD